MRICPILLVTMCHFEFIYDLELICMINLKCMTKYIYTIIILCFLDLFCMLNDADRPTRTVVMSSKAEDTFVAS